MTKEQEEAIKRLSKAQNDIYYRTLYSQEQQDKDIETVLNLIQQLEREKQLHIKIEQQYKSEYLDAKAQIELKNKTISDLKEKVLKINKIKNRMENYYQELLCKYSHQYEIQLEHKLEEQDKIIANLSQRPTLDYFRSVETELKKESKVINEMAKTIVEDSNKFGTFWCNGCTEKCKYSNVSSCVKEYFYKKVENEREEN